MHAHPPPPARTTIFKLFFSTTRMTYTPSNVLMEISCACFTAHGTPSSSSIQLLMCVVQGIPPVGVIRSVVCILCASSTTSYYYRGHDELTRGKNCAEELRISRTKLTPGKHVWKSYFLHSPYPGKHVRYIPTRYVILVQQFCGSSSYHHTTSTTRSSS